MNKNIKKKNLAMAGLLIVSMLFASCSVTESKDEKEIATSGEKFRFTCYSTPYHANTGGEIPYEKHPDQNTTENWKLIADCGFNYAMPVYDVTDAHIIASLEKAQEQGIKVLVMDYNSAGLPQLIKHFENLSYEEAKNSIEANGEKLKARYTEFSKYESFAGLQIFDEPAASYFDAIGAGQDWWYENFPEYEFYVNLLPSYASYIQLFGSKADTGFKYPEYIEQFVEKTNPGFLSYDHYPFIRAGFGANIRTQYLYDLEAFAEASKKYEIPFYCFQLCTKHLNYTEPLTYREYAWQAYTAMAYGCRGLQTFKYWAYLAPEINSLNLGNGLVDRDGNATSFYYAVQEVNREIVAMEDLYMAFTWEGTMPIGASGGGAYSLLRNPLKNLYGVTEVKASGDTIIGQLRDKNRNRGYMVVNYTSPYQNTEINVTMKFANAEKVLICKKGRRIVENLTNNTLQMTLGSGEGYFVIPVL